MTKDLTEQQRKAWDLRHKKNLTFKKVGQELGISVGNAYEQVRVAERKLKTDKEGLKLELKTPAERILQKFDEIEELLLEGGDTALLRMLRDRRLRALAYLDDTALASASAPQLSAVVSAMTQNIQLQEGKPTAITQYSDLAKLDQVLEDVSAELKRRGKMIDVTPETPEEEEKDG